MRKLRPWLPLVFLVAFVLAASSCWAQPPEAEEGNRIHVLLDFSGPLSAEQHDKLDAAGIRLLSYRGRHRYYASIPESASPETLPGFVAPRRPPWREKLAPQLPEPDPSNTPLVGESEQLRVTVEFYTDVERAAAGALLERFDRNSRQSGSTLWNLQIERSRLEELAREDLVKRIAPGPLPFLPLNDTGRVTSNTEIAQAMEPHNPGTRPKFLVDGTGVGIGIFDGGIRHEHPDFDAVESNGGTAGNSRVSPQRSPADRDNPTHGTLVASIAAGSGLRSAACNLQLTEFHLRGHAPNADLGDFASLTQDTAGPLETAVVDYGIAVTNHSYAQSLISYDERSVAFDRTVRGEEIASKGAIPPRPQVWAAGNNARWPQYPCVPDLDHCSDAAGYYSVFAPAKNTIAVGSVDTTEEERLSRFSSLGPTLDGRIKPDLVAPGCRNSYRGSGITASSGFDDCYFFDCGTSMAAPVVTGIIALMMEQYTKTERAGPNDLLPSTYKALLIQTAVDQMLPMAHKKTDAYPSRVNNPDTGTPVVPTEGPDFATGWGLVDAEAARDLVTRRDHWTEDSLGTVEERDEWCIDVVPTAEGRIEPLRVTLAWDDLPGDSNIPQSESRLVNDLDLMLLDPHGSHVSPWLLEPPDPASFPLIVTAAERDIVGVDRRNNVERVDKATPETGSWRIVVSAHALPFGTEQEYSLASSRPLRALTDKGECPEIDAGEEPAASARQEEPDEGDRR